ncbi:MAG TPA: ABC transporter permease, partial [Nocardioidaceae bacterium]|nr:ABC transporter permease [Nocardioidaceae bacterium]
MSTNIPDTAEETKPADDSPGGFSLDVEERSIGDAIRGWFNRLRSGDPGALPSVLGLVVLTIIFTQVSDSFLSKYNIGNIPGQGLYIAIIAMGLVFVLLLGEIDLSAGTAGGTCAAIAAQAVFSGNLHQALPGGLYWGLVVGLVISIGLAVWLKAWTGAAVIALGLILVATNLT